MNKEFIADFIVNHCLEKSQGQLMYGKRPGDRYVWQYYLSRLLYNESYRYFIGKEFIRLVEKEIGHWDFQLAGREWSAIPLLIGLQDHILYHHEHSINVFMIKRERKTYGIHTWVEGEPNHLPVLLVDDLCNSTDSFIHCSKVCKNILHLEVLPFIFAVLNKHNPKIFDDISYDKHLGNNHKALYVVDGEDINAARIRSESTRLTTQID